MRFSDPLQHWVRRHGGGARLKVAAALLGATYGEDGMATKHNADFLRDPRFAAAYRSARAQTGFDGDIRWRAYVACWLAERGARLAGDFVECGVYRGFLSLTVMRYVGFERMTDRTFYLLDTFRGVAPSMVTEEERRLGATRALCGTDAYDDTYPEVVSTFREFANVRIIRGTVPDTLDQVGADRICYLSLDMNNAAPEIAAAEHYWERLVPGAAILLDDYGWAQHIVQKRAFDGFASRFGVGILTLPTGQGLILKP